MADAVEDFFKAQKKDSLYWISLGFLSLALTVFFLLKGRPYFNGLAYVLIATGSIQLIAGMTVYLRSDADRMSVGYFIQKDFELITLKEIPRMKLLLKEYAIFWKAELACVGLGLLLSMSCAPMSLGKGIGFALTVQALVMLVLDYLAVQRTQTYLNFLQSLRPES